MIASDATFNGTFAYTARFTDAPGFRMHYVDEGPADGQVVLCLHGEPTWGYLFRNLLAALSGTYRVIVPDHTGFGKSATPQNRSYWLQDHVTNLEKFVSALGLRAITLVMHDFGGPDGKGIAARHPDLIRKNNTTKNTTKKNKPNHNKKQKTNTSVSPWFQWFQKAHSE